MNRGQKASLPSRQFGNTWDNGNRNGFVEAGNVYALVERRVRVLELESVLSRMGLSYRRDEEVLKTYGISMRTDPNNDNIVLNCDSAVVSIGLQISKMAEPWTWMGGC